MCAHAVVAAGMICALVACGGNAAPALDAAVGCSINEPRTQPLETFIGPTGLQNRLGALIDSADTSLDLQMYLFDVTALASKLVAAKQRGVTIRVILDPGEASANTQVTSILTQGGVAWKNASMIYTFSHAKYMVLDHTSSAIMSMNFNGDAMTNERNYGMVDVDAADIADLQAIFDEDWALANGTTPVTADLACTRLIVSPDNSMLRVLQFIATAQATLDVEALYVTEQNTANAIVAAHNRGVAVRVILESPSDQSENAQTATFFANLGIPVKYADTQFYLHAKLIIADGQALVGSENYSITSLTKNREVAAIAFDPAEVAPIQTQFDSDFAATTPAP